jgi:hypothetical protein
MKNAHLRRYPARGWQASFPGPPEADKNCRVPCIWTFLIGLHNPWFSGFWEDNETYSYSQVTDNKYRFAVKGLRATSNLRRATGDKQCTPDSIERITIDVLHLEIL